MSTASEFGFWRLKAIFDDFGVAGSLVMNSSVCDVYPHIVDACMTAGGMPSAMGKCRRPCRLSLTSAT